MPPKTSVIAKYFAWMSCACILFFIFSVLRPAEEPFYKISMTTRTPTELPLRPPAKPVMSNLAHEDLKYILLWTSTSYSPFKEMGQGRSVFLDKKCNYTNCYITDDKNHFLDVTDFDVVVFNGRNSFHQPKLRSTSQKYIFLMMESSQNYPVCNNQWDGFFNWSWTYRTDSDIRIGYVSFYDKLELHKRLGPKAGIDWKHLERQFDDDLSQEDVKKLENKTRAAAWFVSNCDTLSRRETFARLLEEEMRQLNLTLDVYGACGTLVCPRAVEDQCEDMLKRDYFFYLSFENSFAEDYVTEKLLTAMDHLTVPVVYGGANYSRFLPPSSYLNALELGPAETAKRMHDLISDPVQYRRMLRWRSRLEYRLTWQHEDMCALCAALNNETRLKAVSIIEDLPKWWNPSPDTCGTKSKP